MPGMRALTLAFALLIVACSRGRGGNESASGGRAGTPNGTGVGSTASDGGQGGLTASAGRGGTSDATGGAAGPAAADGPLRIFWVDTEGGAATVLAMPTGEVLVVDAGFSSAHAQRIADLLKSELNTTRIDVMVVSHYHIDHVGGVPALASLVSIGQYLDHGDAVESGSHIDAYMAMFSEAGAPKRTVVKPGTQLNFGAVALTFVTSGGEVVDPPLATAVPNTGCDDATSKTEVAGAENPMSVGFLARYGKFDFLDTADLTWNAEQKLVCPTNRVGVVDLYQVNHHGMDLSSSPQLVNSILPLVAVMNNGAAKGGSPGTFEILKASPGLQDIWSMHHLTANDPTHNADEALTANLEGTDNGYWLKAVIDAKGTLTMTNGRTGMSRTYQAR